MNIIWKREPRFLPPYGHVMSGQEVKVSEADGAALIRQGDAVAAQTRKAKKETK